MKVYNQREIIRIIKANGFVLVRSSGDHFYYQHSDGRHFSITATRTNRMVWQRLVKENRINCDFRK